MRRGARSREACPRLAGEHLSEVGAALTHGRLEADHCRALVCSRHVLGRGREPDDVRPVVGEHRLVPRNAQLQLRDFARDPVQHVHHPSPAIGTESVCKLCIRSVAVVDNIAKVMLTYS